MKQMKKPKTNPPMQTDGRLMSERHPRYEELIAEIDKMPSDRKLKCPACPPKSKAFNGRHSLRVHMARKHSGIAWSRPFGRNARKSVKATGSKKPGSRAADSQEFLSPRHDINFCPNCAFNLSVLRVTMKLAGGKS